MHQQRILIIDFGSQVTQLIARRIREMNVYSQIIPFHQINNTDLQDQPPAGIILSGSPHSVHDENAPTLDSAIFDLNIPMLGICYGFQLIMHSLGGKVAKPSSDKAGHREFGKARLNPTPSQSKPLLNKIDFSSDQAQVWMSHGDTVTALAPDFTPIAATDNVELAGAAHVSRPIYGVQFHPEVVHSLCGAQLLHNFVMDICHCEGTWTMQHYKEEMIQVIRDQVGDAQVICGLSGGVDSSVAAVLIHEAIDDQLHCILVDHGLLRANEADAVTRLFRDHYHIDLTLVNAEDQFMSALAGVSDPEQKRKHIGAEFIKVFEQEAARFPDARFLAQGTLYPDVIESVSPSGGPSQTIKSHHNVGGLPERMNLKLVEPLRALFKDEVRALGATLGLPTDMLNRHPFPGPGLAIRIPGAVDKAQCDLLRQVDSVYIDAIKRHGLYDEIWQAFAVLLPVKSVGVLGDARSYEQVVALRAVCSSDGMTAECYPFTHEFLTETATRIVNEVSGVNRVVYDITSKPPGTIEWE